MDDSQFVERVLLKSEQREPLTREDENRDPLRIDESVDIRSGSVAEFEDAAAAHCESRILPGRTANTGNVTRFLRYASTARSDSLSNCSDSLPPANRSWHLT